MTVAGGDDDPDDDDDDARVRHLFTAADAEKVLGIKAGTIRAWRSRRLLWHFGLDKYGRPMYDRDHLMDLKRGSTRLARQEQRTRRNRGS